LTEIYVRGKSGHLIASLSLGRAYGSSFRALVIDYTSRYSIKAHFSTLDFLHWTN